MRAGAASTREGGRRRRLGGDDDDDDEEYVLEEEEEELSASSAGEEGESSDKEYEEEEEDDEEDETPRPKRPVKGGIRERKGKAATVRSRRRKYEEDDDYLDEIEEDDGVDEYQVDLEQEEEDDDDEAPKPKRVKKCGGGGSPKGKLALVTHGSNRQRYEEDMDFEPDLDVEEEEDDFDFDPEVEVEEEEFEDEEEEDDGEELGMSRTRKVNSVRRRPALKQQRGKKKKNSSSKVSRRKVNSAKARKAAPVRRRQRKRSMTDRYVDDDDFIEDDQVTVNRPPRKKARVRRQAEVDPSTPVFEAETWPTVDSDTSDFDFVTSDEEPEDVETSIVEPARVKVKKGRKKRMVLSESSSDSEFVVSDKKFGESIESEPPESLQLLPASPRSISVAGYIGYKGKGKKEPEEPGRAPCGICLSEEQRVTVQGVLNCCSHFFCFGCIMEWSKVESRCPLCKRRFSTVTKVDLGLQLTKSVIRVEERDQVYQPTEEEIRRWLDPYENVVCIECNQGGDDNLMLLCDICDSSAHTYCVGLGREVPEGNWYCGGCRLSGERRSYPRSPVDCNSGLFGATARNGAFERQGIDLNESPREISRGNYSVEAQASAVGVSTISGRRATHSRRPQWIHHLFTAIRPDICHNGVQHSGGSVQRTEPSHMNSCAPSESNISLHHDSVPRSERNNNLHATSESNASQIMFGRHGSLSERRQLYQHVRNLFRPMPASRPDVCHNTTEHNGSIGRTEPNNRNFHASPEANISQTLLDGVRNTNNGSSFVQAQSNFVDGNNLQETKGV